MRISRVVVAPGTAASRTFVFEPDLAVISETPAETERLLAAFQNLYLGSRHDSQIFATIDGVEFEISSGMMPLIGERLGGQFGILDLAVPPSIATNPTDLRDAQSVVARAALEIVGAIPATLNLERIDQAAFAVDRHLDQFANAAHAAHLQRAGVRQLFSRRAGRDILDPGDPAVGHLIALEQTLAQHRRNIDANATPSPDDHTTAREALRVLVSVRIGGLPPEMAAAMTTDAIEQDVMQWVVQQHDRQVAPIVAEVCSRHAAGIDVLGPIPAVIDLRGIEGLPPARDSMRWAARQHGERLQFIVLVSDDDTRRWIEGTFASSEAA